MTFVRLNRRSKIAGAIALVPAAWFWPDDYDNAVNIEFAGAATSDLDVVSLTIAHVVHVRAAVLAHDEELAAVANTAERMRLCLNRAYC